ncbi:hypothetical protein [Reticulibacter mediterranei]|nr:hypothetical protein [Reticulibacter mediterranei]
MSKADLSNPMVGPARHYWFSRSMAGGVMIKGTLRTGFSITTCPHAGIYGIDQHPTFQGILSQEYIDRLTVDVALNQSIIDTAP